MQATKYTISESALKQLPGCRNHWQAGDSYCPAGKLAVLATGETRVCWELSDGTLLVNQRCVDFLIGLQKAVGQSLWQKVFDVNDYPKGNFRENHEYALALLLDGAIRAGYIKLVP